jgi:hypothetical protein
MQKFRFLLPLLILTFIVIAVSYGVHNYVSSGNVYTNVATTQEGEEVQTDEGAETQKPQKTPGGFLARIFGTKKTTSTQNSSTGTTATITPMPSPISTAFSQTEVSLPLNEQRDVFISLDTGTNSPTAYTFNMHFDPKSINVLKLEPGDIWQQSTIFTKANKIDNTKGTLSFSAGQALGTQKGNGKTLLKISIKATSATQVGSELTVENTSKFTYIASDNSVYAVALKQNSIQVQVTK